MSYLQQSERSDEILTRREFQNIFRISQSKFFLMKANGELPFFRKAGGKLLAPRQEAVEWFNSLPSAVGDQEAA